MHTIWHYVICGSQPQLRLLLTRIFSKKKTCAVWWVQLPVTRRRVDIFWSGGIKRTTQVVKKWHCIFAVFIWGNKLLLLHRSPKLRHIFWRILRFLDINLHPSFKSTRGYCCWEWKETSLWAFFVDFYFLQTSQLYKSFKAVSLNKITLWIFYDFIFIGLIWSLCILISN